MSTNKQKDNLRNKQYFDESTIQIPKLKSKNNRKTTNNSQNTPNIKNNNYYQKSSPNKKKKPLNNSKNNISQTTNNFNSKKQNKQVNNYNNDKKKTIDEEIDEFNKELLQKEDLKNNKSGKNELEAKNQKNNIERAKEIEKEIDNFDKEDKKQTDIKQKKNDNDKDLKPKDNIEDTNKFDTTKTDNQKLNINDLKRELEIIYGEKKIEKPKTKIVKKKRLRPWVFYLLIIIFSSILVFSGYQIYKWHKDNQNIKELKKDIDTDIKPKENNEQGELVNPPDDKNSDYWYYINLPFYEVDFNELKKKNSDTVAFIHMNNTNINYPVVQTSNNDYYLTHAFDKSKNNAGWVFMDYRNTLSPLSDNIVIYGHGRVNKTVFGSLKDALSKSWQKNKDNFVIWLSTPNENLLYQIFSIYTVQSESYYISTDFATNSDKQNWLNTMKQRNTASIDTPVDVSDNIITLSTCQNNNGGRIVVQAKLIKRQTR